MAATKRLSACVFLGIQFGFVIFLQGCSQYESVENKVDSLKLLRSEQTDLEPPQDVLYEPQSESIYATVVNTTVGRSGRYMTLNGKPTFFLGVDTQDLAANPAYNYTSVLDKLAASRINKVRIWIYCFWNPDGFLHPWVRTGGKYNLDKWNETYWSRVKAVVNAANSRGIVVEATIFSDYPNRNNRFVTSSPFYKGNNVNGAFSANSSGHFYPEFFDLSLAQKSSSGKTLKVYQQALIDKTITELGSYSNVYFEVMNEFPGVLALCGTARCIDQVHPWQTYWVNYISSKTSKLVTAHSHEFKLDTNGVQYFWNNSAVDVLNFHFYSSSPASTGNSLNKMQLKNKVLQENESSDFASSGVATVVKQMWAMFISGGHYGIYIDAPSRLTHAGWPQIANSAKFLRNFSDKFALGKMSPVDSSGKEYDNLVITTGLSGSKWQVLAYPGFEYAAYFYDGTSGNIKANLPSGKTYSYTWYDARDGKTLRTGTVSGGTSVTLTGPGTFDKTMGAALFIKASSGEIILDNLSPGASSSAISFTGKWCVSGATGFYGANSLYSCGTSTIDRYKFTPNIPTTRNYNVYVRYAAHANRSADARFSVKHAAGTTTKNYNEKSGGGAWILHGTYKLNAGTGSYVETYETSAGGQVSADAVRFVPAP